MTYQNDRVVNRRQPLPLAVRERKLIDGEYHVPPRLHGAFHARCEETDGTRAAVIDIAVAFIDEYGEWL